MRHRTNCSLKDTKGQTDHQWIYTSGVEECLPCGRETQSAAHVLFQGDSLENGRLLFKTVDRQREMRSGPKGEGKGE